MSQLVSFISGAAIAIAGGLAGAVFQTRRADEVARAIRRAERREQALLDFNAVVTDIYGQLLGLYRIVERGQNAAQFTEARQKVDQLRAHWDSRAAGIIGDQNIVAAYTWFNAAVHESLPGDGQTTLRRVQELSSGSSDAGQRFKRDLGHVVGTLDDLRKSVHEQVELLDSKTSSRRLGRVRAHQLPWYGTMVPHGR